MSRRGYARLLALLPREFREDLGADMQATFEARREEARRRGRVRHALFCAREVLGLVQLVITERLRRRRDGERKGRPRMEMMLREVTQAARRLLRAPGFTAAAVLTLALAFGANGAIFTLVQRVVLSPLPYAESDRLIALEHAAPGLNIPSGMGMSAGLYREYKALPSVQSAALYTPWSMTLSDEGGAERVDMLVATPSLGEVLRIVPAAGRWFNVDEGERGAASVVLLSHALWQTRFGGNAGVIGRTVRLDGNTFEIVGVMPPGFAFPDDRPQLVLPLHVDMETTRPGGFNYRGIARLAPGFTATQARAEQNAVIADLPARFPAERAFAELMVNEIGVTSLAAPLRDNVLGETSRTLWVLLASVAVLLLIACANIANLFLVRTEARQREVAVRRALGAGSGRVAAYFLAEALLVCLAAAAAGLAIAWAAVDAVTASSTVKLPRMHEIRFGVEGVAFTLVLALGAALAFGVLPLLRRAASVGPVLQDAGRGNSAGVARMRLRHGLMAVQVSLAVMLLVAAGLLVRSFDHLRRVDPGFASESRLTFRIGLPQSQYADNPGAASFHASLLERISGLAGVQAAAFTTTLPLSGDGWGDPFDVRGRVLPQGAVSPIVRLRRVSHGYFDAVEIPLLAGRAFDAIDDGGSTNAVIVNRAFAEQYFPGEDPIGRQIRPFGNEDADWLSIVGIVANTATYSLRDEEAVPQAFLPAHSATTAQMLTAHNVSYVVHTASHPLTVLPPVRRAVEDIDPHVAIARAEPLAETVSRARAGLAFTMLLIVTAATVALLLGTIGVYAVISYGVAQRRGEIGVRIALGARPHDVTRMIVRQSGAVVAVGVVAGLGGAVAASRLLGALLYGVAATDAATYGAVAIGLFAVALVACWVPARRAAHISPSRLL